MKLRWTLVIIGILAVLVLGYIGLDVAHLDANLITALVTALAAAFAGWSAYLSSRAARETTQTARDAVRALSWATKPIMNVGTSLPGLSDHHLVYIQNDSLHPVSTSTVRWTLADGRTGERTFGWLKGRTNPKSSIIVAGAWGVHYDPIDFGDFHTNSGQDKYEIDYRGASGPTTWRTILVVTYYPQPGGDRKSFAIGTERISDTELV